MWAMSFEGRVLIWRAWPSRSVEEYDGYMGKNIPGSGFFGVTYYKKKLNDTTGLV